MIPLKLGELTVYQNQWISLVSGHPWPQLDDISYILSSGHGHVIQAGQQSK